MENKKTDSIFDILNLDIENEAIDIYYGYESFLSSIIKEDSVLTIWNLLNMFSYASYTSIISDECILDEQTSRKLVSLDMSKT